jgi:hypothetical protein
VMNSKSLALQVVFDQSTAQSSNESPQSKSQQPELTGRSWTEIRNDVVRDLWVQSSTRSRDGPAA